MHMGGLLCICGMSSQAARLSSFHCHGFFESCPSSLLCIINRTLNNSPPFLSNKYFCDSHLQTGDSIAAAIFCACSFCLFFSVRRKTSWGSFFPPLILVLSFCPSPSICTVGMFSRHFQLNFMSHDITLAPCPSHGLISVLLRCLHASLLLQSRPRGIILECTASREPASRYTCSCGCDIFS